MTDKERNKLVSLLWIILPLKAQMFYLADRPSWWRPDYIFRPDLSGDHFVPGFRLWQTVSVWAHSCQSPHRGWGQVRPGPWTDARPEYLFQSLIDPIVAGNVYTAVNSQSLAPGKIWLSISEPPLVSHAHFHLRSPTTAWSTVTFIEVVQLSII